MSANNHREGGIGDGGGGSGSNRAVKTTNCFNLNLFRTLMGGQTIKRLVGSLARWMDKWLADVSSRILQANKEMQI